MDRVENRQGLLCALPMLALLALVFVVPLIVVALFSVMPPRVFELTHTPSLANYQTFLVQGYWRSLFWSIGTAFLSTVILFLVCYPLAFAMAKVFKRFSLVIVIAVVVSLVVSENIRLFGWVLTLMRGGMLAGYVQAWTGIQLESWLFNVPVIVFGLVYVYFPFMLFPLAQGIATIPDDVRQAAADLGATRWQILKEIDLPLAMPGIVVGSLLSFVLAAGAIAESRLLGGQRIVVMAHEIENAFTYGQNWPLGSALSMVLILITGALAVTALRWVDLDAILGRKR
jgi:spermidine/putrescine transport system permease protein